MTTQTITNSIQYILQDVLWSVPTSLFTHDAYRHEALISAYFRLSAIDMTYLFFEVEKAFDIGLEGVDVVEYRVNIIEQDGGRCKWHRRDICIVETALVIES